MENDYEDIISGGLKTKFKVTINLFSIFKLNHNHMVSVMNKFYLEKINSSTNIFLSRKWLHTDKIP